MLLHLGLLEREISEMVPFELNFGGIHLGRKRGRIFGGEGTPLHKSMKREKTNLA